MGETPKPVALTQSYVLLPYLSSQRSVTHEGKEPYFLHPPLASTWYSSPVYDGHTVNGSEWMHKYRALAARFTWDMHWEEKGRADVLMKNLFATQGTSGMRGPCQLGWAVRLSQIHRSEGPRSDNLRLPLLARCSPASLSWCPLPSLDPRPRLSVQQPVMMNAGPLSAPKNPAVLPACSPVPRPAALHHAVVESRKSLREEKLKAENGIVLGVFESTWKSIPISHCLFLTPVILYLSTGVLGGLRIIASEPESWVPNLRLSLLSCHTRSKPLISLSLRFLISKMGTVP